MTMIYFLIWIFLGNYVLLNLFLAVLLDGFGVYGDELTDVIPDELHLKEDQKPEIEEIPEWSKKVLAVEEDPDEEKEYIEYSDVDCQYSVWLFHKENPIRKFMYSVYRHPWFDQLILVVIVISSFKLMIDTYFDQDLSVYSTSEKNFISVMDIVDIIFNVIFIIEMIVKIISLGFALELNSYLRNTWNQLDFIIVVFSIVDMSLAGQDLAFLKVVRMLRILRPLRFISHNPSMKVLVNSLIESIGGLANVSIVIVLIWLMFAILFLSLLSGNSGFCYSEDLEDSIGINKEQCLCSDGPDCINGTWLHFDVNFDNILTSMVSLFVISTLEGWPDYLFQSIDGAGPDTGPIYNNNTYVTYLFMSFIMVGSIFCVNLFVAIVSMNFHIA